MLRVLLLLAIPSAVAAADLTVKGCSGNWAFDPLTNTATCGTVTPPPPPPATIACAGYTRTIVQQIPWAGQSLAPTSGLTKTVAYVGVIKIPLDAVTPNAGWVAIVEYGDGAHRRTAALSRTPCDFSGGASMVMEPSLRFTVAPTHIVGYQMFNPGDTVYVNLFNNDCGTGTCNINVQFNKP